MLTAISGAGSLRPGPGLVCLGLALLCFDFLFFVFMLGVPVRPGPPGYPAARIGAGLFDASELGGKKAVACGPADLHVQFLRGNAPRFDHFEMLQLFTPWALRTAHMNLLRSLP